MPESGSRVTSAARPCRIHVEPPTSATRAAPFRRMKKGNICMAKKGRTAILKRQREVKKAERAAMKREKRESRKEAEPDPDTVATAEDLAGYGFGSTDDEKNDKDAGPDDD